MNVFLTVIPETKPEYLGIPKTCHGRVYCLVITLSLTEKAGSQMLIKALSHSSQKQSSVQAVRPLN